MEMKRLLLLFTPLFLYSKPQRCLTVEDFEFLDIDVVMYENRFYCVCHRFHFVVFSEQECDHEAL